MRHYPTWLILFFVGLLLAGCVTANQATQTASHIANIPSATPLPPPQAIDLGVLGKGTASDVAWSPDGRLMAIASTGGVFLYDTQTWQVQQTIPQSATDNNTVGELVFSPDGKSLFLVVEFRVTLFRYNLESGQLTRLFKNASFQILARPILSPNGEIFVLLSSSCNENGVIQCRYALEIRESATGTVLYTLQQGQPEGDHTINAAVFSPDGQLLAAASNDNLVRVWDVQNGQLLHELAQESDVLDVTFSPDGRLIVAVGRDAKVHGWDSQTGQAVFTLDGFTQVIQHVAYLQAGRKLLLGLYDGTFEQWDVDERFAPLGQNDFKLKTSTERAYTRLDTTSNRIFVSPDTGRMALLVNGGVQIWNLQTGQMETSLPEFLDSIDSLAFSPDGKLLAVGAADLHIWQMQPRRFLAALSVGGYGVKDIAFSPDGKQVALAVSQGGLQIWDLESRQKVQEITDEDAQCGSAVQVAFSPDGSLLAGSGWCGAWVWDIASGKRQLQITAGVGEARELRFDKSGQQLIGVGARGLWNWNLATGQANYLRKDFSGRIWSAVIASDRIVLSPEDQGNLKFLDLASGKFLYDFALPIGYSDVSLNGQLVAYEGLDKIVLADVFSGTEYLTIPQQSVPLFSPDGKILLTAHTYSAIIQLWDVSSVVLQAQAAPHQTATPEPTPVATQTATPVPVLSISGPTLPPPTIPKNALRPENVAQLTLRKELGLGEVYTAAWSPDGKNLALAGYPQVYLFGQGDSQPKVSLPAENRIGRLVFSPTGRFLAGQADLSIQVWDVSTGRSLFSAKDLDNPGCWSARMSFSDDEQFFSAQCRQITYRWHVLDGTLQDKTAAQHSSGQLSPDGNWLVQSNHNTVQLLEAGTGKIIQSSELPNMTPVVTGFSPDGKIFLAWFYRYEVARSGAPYPGQNPESVIQLWDIRPDAFPSLRASLPAGKWQRWEGDMLQGFRAFDFTPDSAKLVTTSGDSNLRVWDVKNGKLLHTWPGRGKSVYVSPDGRLVAVTGDKVQIWNLASRRLAWEIPGFSAFRSLLALTNPGSQWVTVWDSEFRFWRWDGTSLIEHHHIISAPETGAIYHPAVSPDGKWLAYATKTGLRLGENNPAKPNWRELKKYPDQAFDQNVQAIIFSPDGSHLAVADAERKILLWDLKNQAAPPLELAKDTYLSDLVFSPDGNLLLGSSGNSGSESDLYLWDIANGTLLRTWKAKGYQFAFHPNGSILAAADYSSGEIVLYDLRTWTPIRKMKGPQYVRLVAFSPDGSLLLTNGDKTTNICDASTGKLLNSLTGYFSRLVFSPDGKMLIASLSDGRIQVFGLPEK